MIDNIEYMFDSKRDEVSKLDDALITNYTVTFYDSDADLNKIIGTSPMVMNSAKEAINILANGTGESWLDNDNVTIVIRKMKMLSI